MKNIIFASMLILLTFATACKKGNETVAPTSDAVKKSSITGLVSPANAAEGIKIINNEHGYTFTPDTLTGSFKVNDVIPGTYSVSFSGRGNFVEPPLVTINVSPDQNYDLGKVVFQLASITGTTIPAGSAKNISIHDAAGNAYRVFLDPVTGKFKSVALAAGNYSVSFSSAAGYAALPETKSVTLVEGQTTDIGSIYFLINNFAGNPFSLLGYRGNYAAPKFSITAGGTDIDYGRTRRFEVVMDNITAPGTYVCKNTGTSVITYTLRNSSFSPTIVWSTANPGGSGTVIVTSIDPVKKEITGTFTATLTNASNADLVISHFSFDFIYK